MGEGEDASAILGVALVGGGELGDGCTDVGDGLEVGGADCGVVEGGVEAEAGALLDGDLHLHLPGVDAVKVRLEHLLHEGLGRFGGGEEGGVIVAADAVATLGGDDDLAAVADAESGGDDALDGLVEVEVGGMAAVAADDDVVGAFDGAHGLTVDVGDGGVVGGDEVAAEDAGDALVGVEGDVAEEVDAGVEGDAPDVFKDGVAFGDAVGGVVVGEVGNAVVAHDVVCGGDAGEDAFAATAVAGEEVRFDEAGDDADGGLHEGGVEVDAAASLAGVALQEDLLIGVAGVVGEDAVAAGDIGAEQGVDLGGAERLMQAAADEEGDLVAGDAGGGQGFEQGGRDLPVGDGAGVVAEDDGDVVIGPDAIGQGGRADGGGDGGPQIGGEVGQGRRGERLDHVGVVGQIDGQSVVAVGKLDAHGERVAASGDQAPAPSDNEAAASVQAERAPRCVPGVVPDLPAVDGLAPELASTAGQWPSANRDLHGTRAVFDSPIDSTTVADLELAWDYPLTGRGGAFGQAATNPLIIDGRVYLQDLASGLHVIDLESGESGWELALEALVFGPNGLAVGWGRVFAAVRGTSISAYDAVCGELLWETRLRDTGGGSVDIQPIVAGELVLAATSSLSQPGSRGVLFGLDPTTGEVVWSFDTIESPDLWGNPFVNSGGGAWYPPAVDLEAGLVFWGISNAYPFPGVPGFPNGSSRPGDNRWTASVLALDLATGALRWGFQHFPHDIFDRDMVLSAIATVETSDGPERVVINTGKGAVVAGFDPLSGERLWSTSVGRHQNDDLPSFEGSLQVLPGTAGGVETPIAMAEGIVYVAVVNAPVTYDSPTDSEGQTEIGVFPSQVVALNASSGEIVWDVEVPGDSFGGVTVVNDLLFVSLIDGRLLALSRDDGTQLWSRQLPAGINAWPAVAGDMIVLPAGLGLTPQLVALRLR